MPVVAGRGFLKVALHARNVSVPAAQSVLARSSAALLSRFSRGLLPSVVAVLAAASWAGNGSDFNLTFDDNEYIYLRSAF